LTGTVDFTMLAFYGLSHSIVQKKLISVFNFRTQNNTMEEKQQVTNKRPLKLINAIKANDDIFENSLETISPNLQIINHRDKDDNNNDYTYVDHLRDFFENEMGAYYVKNEVSNASIIR